MKYLNKLIGMLMVVGAMTVQTQALTISPGTELESENSPNSTSAILTYLASLGYDLDAASYKVEAPSGTEEGSFSGAYKTVFNADLSGATITQKGPSYITDAAYLLVKDGNHTPAWYFFDIAGWDGKEQINLTEFWPGEGAISHVSIYGGSRTTVPDGGATAALLGLGVLGLAAVRRKS